ncbi:MAG TPA: tRNA (adenosine(37)-N6)-threonylcarbamoyltransferase complex dimerization subunit type 1 TsaB, partial [Saprospiraceae bacterium]|nr:tRNA (adenosine(37)-N6)-threonylcarbamoyltransferase complex dimerization subunit type 1 TsaB [Saprospiraceae bacterium]
MARILLIETATEVCSAALAIDGVVVALQEEPQSTQHAALLTLQIEACMQQAGIEYADLDAVAVSSGPGSYTSLRVGASVAKGLCYALRKPLIAVDTLLALAYASRRTGDQAAPVRSGVLYIPMLDARRQEVWTAAYDADMNQVASAQPLVIENNLFENFISSLLRDSSHVELVFSGNGAFKVKNVRQGQEVAKTRCSAADLAFWA